LEELVATLPPEWRTRPASIPAKELAAVMLKTFQLQRAVDPWQVAATMENNMFAVLDRPGSQVKSLDDMDERGDFDQVLIGNTGAGEVPPGQERHIKGMIRPDRTGYTVDEADQALRTGHMLDSLVLLKQLEDEPGVRHEVLRTLEA